MNESSQRNICITINSLDRGGAEKQSLLLAKALKNHHRVVLVIVSPQPVYPQRLKTIHEEAIDHLFLSGNLLVKLGRFVKFLKQRKIEIIFSFLPTDTVLSAIAGKIAGVNHVFGGIRNSYLGKFKFAALKLAHNYLLDYTIANNYAAYHNSLAYGFKKKVLVIPNGIQIRVPRSGGADKPQKQVNIVSLGRLVKQKDYITAVKSIFILNRKLHETIRVNYRIIGQGPEEQAIRECIEEHSLEQVVEIIPHTDEIYSYLETSDIYLCTSIFEGISNSILEALNCSLPVVATDAGDNSHLVIDGETGFIVDLHDDRGLANHLQYLIENPQKRAKMGLEGHKHLKANFGFEVFREKYLKVIENVDKKLV